MSFSRPRLFTIALLVIMTITAVLAFVLRKSVTLTIDGELKNLTTYAFTVGDLLHEQGIPLSPVDKLLPSQSAWLKNGEQVTLQRAIPVQVLAGGMLHSTYSADRLPINLLAQVGVEIHPDDQVLSTGKPIQLSQSFPPESESISLQVVPSIDYTLSVEGKELPLSSTAPTLGSALWAAGHILFAADELLPPADTPLSPNLSAEWWQSRQVIIQTQSGDVAVRTSAQTVGAALEDAHLSLQGLNYSLPASDEPLPPDGIVQLVHVTDDVLVEQTPLPFETSYQPVPDLEIDTQSIVQTGEYGLTAQRVRVRYEDGVEMSRQVEGEWVARQPVPRIVGYGTQVSMKTTVVDGREIQYWRSLNMYATSYHPSTTGNTTASGLPLQKGVAAVDRNYIPFYTQMYIPGYGEATAADIGGGVKGRMIDLGYSDSDYVPWHQWVTVYFLWPPPANIVWIIP